MKKRFIFLNREKKLVIFELPDYIIDSIRESTIYTILKINTRIENFIIIKANIL